MSFAAQSARGVKQRSQSEIFREINISRGSWPLIVIVGHRTTYERRCSQSDPATRHSRKPRKDFEVGGEPAGILNARDTEW